MRCPDCNTPNPDSMRFCGNCGHALLGQSVAALGRERRNVSVVFIDLSGFTKLTHNFDPEELRDLADGILTVIAGIIEDYDGYVDAFQGDGLIALFGAPHSHPDDPYRAVEAAAAGLAAIERIGESKGYTLKGRAGVNTGVVIAGSVGSGRVKDYTVMGSAVNLAARLEAAATPGEVWVGPSTLEATQHRASYEAVNNVSLAGFPDVTTVYRLKNLDSPSELDPYSELTFVGRKAELTQLRERFTTSVETREVGAVWLYGEVGSGKTRLAREFAKTMHPEHLIWLEEQPLSTEAMWHDLALALFQLELNSPNWELGIMAGLEDLLPGEARWQTYILRSLGLLAAQPWRRLERRGVDRTFLAWRDLVLAYARRHGGVVMAVEHSTQGSSFGQFLDLFDGENAPLLILRTNRGRELPTGGEVIQLGPLELTESLALISQVTDPMLQVATESLIMQVGGVPANVLELGRALGMTPESSFSDSLGSLLQARLDMLDPAARQLLAFCALVGQNCWDGLVLSLVQANGRKLLEGHVTDHLLVKEASSSIPGQTEYRFQSELLRHAVLGMIPFSERPLLHLRIGSWLETHAPLDLSARVGHHFREGESHEAAYPHYLAAADLAVSDADTEEAKRLFDILLDLDLPNYLLAQGALAYAQAALSTDDAALAKGQLEKARTLIAGCSKEDQVELWQVHRQLSADLRLDAVAVTATP